MNCPHHTTADLVDNGAHFDPHDPDMRRDPFTVYESMRSRCPVAFSEEWGGFWALSRYEDIFQAAREPETFNSAPGVMLPPIGNKHPLLPMEADPPGHMRYRRLLMPRFSPGAIAAMEPHIRRVVDRLIDNFIDQTECDLGAVFALRLPMEVICEMLGVEGDYDRLWGWADAIVYERIKDPEAGLAAANELRNYMAEVVRERRVAPADDLISFIVESSTDEAPMTDDEVLDLCTFLLMAGLDNTAFSIRSTLWYLATDQEARSLASKDPEQIPAIVEEALRMFTPVPSLARTTSKPVTVDGVRVEAGERVLLLWASANRDPAEFTEPDVFEIGREPNRHLAFGIGIHRCLGAHLARLELRVAVEQMLSRVPDYELRDADVPWYGLSPLPVVLRPSEAPSGG